jgi:hypothetical protein
VAAVDDAGRLHCRVPLVSDPPAAGKSRP